MAVIKQNSIEDLKSRINIVDVVASVVALKRSGSQYKGLSPFNPERTPSFFVSPERNMFKCFSSGMAGDIFTFVMETERLTFYEAAETLAQRFGIELEYEKGGLDRQERSLRQMIFEIHEIAAGYFREQFLSEAEDAAFTRRYWEEERGFDAGLAESFRIGLAPPDGSGLRQRLTDKKFPLEALRQSGLFYERGQANRPEALHARFRNRLMIPIRDHQGRVVAFTARQLEITPKDDPTHEAKYINSPETPIFSKSHLLFGLDRARMEVGDETSFLLVEGQLDVIRCHEQGLKTAVAPQGTSITESQLALLKRYAPALECLLDSDSAGQKAALRLLPQAFKVGIEVRFLTLPEGEDPDTYLRKGGSQALASLRADAVDAITFATRNVLPDPAGTSPEKKTQALEQLFEIIRQSESEIVRSEHLRRVSRLARLPEAAVLDDFQHYLRRRRRTAPASAADKKESGAPAAPKKLSTATETLVAICLHDDYLGKPIAEVLDHDWLDNGKVDDRLLNRLLAEFEHDEWQGADQIDSLLETIEEKHFAYSILFRKPYHDDPEKLANQALKALHIDHLNRKIKQIELEIANNQEILDDGIVFLQRKIIEHRRRKTHPPKLEVT